MLPMLLPVTESPVTESDVTERSVTGNAVVTRKSVLLLDCYLLLIKSILVAFSNFAFTSHIRLRICPSDGVLSVVVYTIKKKPIMGKRHRQRSSI